MKTWKHPELKMRRNPTGLWVIALSRMLVREVRRSEKMQKALTTISHYNPAPNTTGAELRWIARNGLGR